MPTSTSWIAIANRLNMRLKALNKLMNRSTGPGWATRAHHIQTYGYLVALQRKLESTHGTRHTMPGKYRPISGGGYSKADVMLLAQLVIMALNHTGIGRNSQGLLVSVKKAIRR